MCFSIAWIGQMLIWLIVVCAVVAIIQVLLRFVLPGLAPAGGPVMQILTIVMYAAVAIFIVFIIVQLLECVVYGGPRLR